MGITEFLELLDGVRKYSGYWMARCPAHDDRTPSLKLAEGDDGRILIDCKAGCPPNNVVAAVGKEMRDLFPNIPSPSARTRKPPMDYLWVLSYEASLVSMAACDIAAGKTLSEVDLARVTEAQSRIRKIMETFGVNYS